MKISGLLFFVCNVKYFNLVDAETDVVSVVSTMSTEYAAIRDSIIGRYSLGFYLRYLVGTETDAVRVVKGG